jgi:carbonic anhydrase
VKAPTELTRHHHVRGAQRNGGQETNHDHTAFYDSIANAVESAREIVVVGHGKGKANEMLRLTQYWERKRPEVAHKVIGAIDSDLEALTENQVLALIREWFEHYREMN